MREGAPAEKVRERDARTPGAVAVEKNLERKEAWKVSFESERV